MLELRGGTRKSDKQFIHSHEFASNQPTSQLVQCWNTLDVKTSRGQLRIHKIHHDLDLGEATTFPHIVYFAPLHEAHIQMVSSRDSQRGVLKSPRLELLHLCRAIISCSDLQA